MKDPKNPGVGEDPELKSLYDEIDDTEENPYQPQPLRIRWGSGGVKAFIDASTGETIKELTGVVPISRIARAFWRIGFEETGGGAPPDCYSNDGVTGSNPEVHSTLDCATCNQNDFGSDGRRGKACKELRRLIMVTNDGLPYLISVPPSSLRYWDQYCTALRGKGLRYYAVITKLSLEKAQNRDGIEYAQLRPELVDILKFERVKEIAEQRGTFVKALVGPAALAELSEPTDEPGNEEEELPY